MQKEDKEEDYNNQLKVDDQFISDQSDSDRLSEKNVNNNVYSDNIPPKQKATTRQPDEKSRKRILTKSHIEQDSSNAILHQNPISGTNLLSEQYPEAKLSPKQHVKNLQAQHQLEKDGSSTKKMNFKKPEEFASIFSQDFEQLRFSPFFVDKTLLIQEYLQNSNRNVMLTRPRRWGKTLGVSMLRYFFSNSNKISEGKTTIFKDTLIWKSKEIDFSYLQQFYERNQTYEEFEKEINLTMIDLDIQNHEDWKNLKNQISGRADILLKKDNEQFLIKFRKLREQYFSESLELLGLSQDIRSSNKDEAIKILKQRLNFCLNTEINNESDKILSRFSIRRHLNQHPVILITLKKQFNENSLNMYCIAQSIIYNSYSEHFKQLTIELTIILEKSTTAEQILAKTFLNKITSIIESKNSILVETAIEDLSEILYFVYHKKVIILVDEFDIFVSSSRQNKEIYDRALNITCNILYQVIKLQTFTFGTFVIGITRASLGDLFSGLNEFSLYTVLQENFSSHFGFLENEIKNLIQKILKNNVEGKFTTFQKWYNGYLIGNDRIYNPWSSVQCLNNLQSEQQENSAYQPYWLVTGNTEDFEKAFLSKESNLEIIFKENVTVVIPKVLNLQTALTTSEGFYTMLLDSGYITPTGQTNEYRIPNLEVKTFFLSTLFPLWLCQEYKIDTKVEFKNIIADISQSFKNYKNFQTRMNLIIMPFFGEKLQNESTFNSIIFSLILNQKLLQNQIISHLMTEVHIQERGVIDGFFIPVEKISTDVILQEYKVVRNRKSIDKYIQVAFHQIFDQRYISHPLQLLKDHEKTYNFWRTISVRAVVFFQNPEGIWNVRINQIQLSLKNAEKIDNFFNKYKLKCQKKPKETLKEFNKNNIEFLENNKVHSMDELVNYVIQFENQQEIFDQMNKHV